MNTNTVTAGAPSYRMLEVGETIEPGDEFRFWPSSAWEPATASVGCDMGSLDVGDFRRKVATPPQTEPGYRILARGETIQAGDEINLRAGWKPTSFPGDTVDEGTYRRKIAPPQAVAPGDGYRLLAPGEIIEAEDEAWFAVLCQWDRTLNPGLATRLGGLVYRRKLPAPVQIVPGVGYRLLKTGEALLAGDECWNQPALCWRNFFVGEGTVADSDFVYQRKIESPKPIEPGAGYRLLALGETLQAGDEFFWGGSRRWVLTGEAGTEVTSVSLIYRRKSEPVLPEVGDGYRVVGDDETIQKGDEFFVSGDWNIARASVGETPSANQWRSSFREPKTRVYRRKVQAGEGYRLLIVGEMVLDGDEYWNTVSYSWQRAPFVNQPLRKGLKCPLLYRRKVESAPSYRMLVAGEPLQAGDEFVAGQNRHTSGQLKWQPIYERVIGSWLSERNVGFFRRPVSACAEVSLSSQVEQLTKERNELREGITYIGEVCARVLNGEDREVGIYKNSIRFLAGSIKEVLK